MSTLDSETTNELSTVFFRIMKMNYGITKTEYNIIKRINSLKAVSNSDIEHLTNKSKRNAEFLISKLKEKGLVEKSFLSPKKIVFSPTALAKQIMGTSNPEPDLRSISEHGILCSKLSLLLCKRGIDDKKIQIETQIPSGSTSHEAIFPDLSILLSNGRFICVELELTQKCADRLSKKISKYCESEIIERVIYLCSNGAIRHQIRREDPSLKVIALPIEPIEKASSAIFNIISGLENV